MDKPSLLDDLQARLARFIEDTPAADLQRNLRAVLEQGLQRLDLVTREDLDTYVQWAASMRQRVAQLEARLEALERVRPAAAEQARDGPSVGDSGAGGAGSGQSSGPAPAWLSGGATGRGAGRGESPDYPG